MNNEPRQPQTSQGSSGSQWAQPPPPPYSQPTPDEHGARPETPTAKSCPACLELVPHEAFVCRSCRYDWRTGSFADLRQRANGLAVASLVTGLVALLIFPLVPLSALGGLLALLMGAVSKRQIKRSNGVMAGEEMARFGLLLGIIALGVAVGLAVAAYALDFEAVTVNLSG
ncbi:MAG: DUF4190 domain-containing protein [Actinomycetota bacterium]